jgi:hypothetical protein
MLVISEFACNIHNLKNALTLNKELLRMADEMSGRIPCDHTERFPWLFVPVSPWNEAQFGLIR